MVTFDCACTHHDGVTLVTLTLTQIQEPTRVTVRNCLDGPVWPPRRQGIPEDGWDETGFEAVLSPGSHAFGYATPAEPAAPPAELLDVMPASDAELATDTVATVEDVCRRLGDPSPPADVVGTGAKPESHQCGQDSHPSPLPDRIRPWFDELTRRVAHAEALDDVESLDDATAAVADVGGLTGVRAIAAQSSTDERALRTVARLAEELAERRAAATVPTETLARLA